MLIKFWNDIEIRRPLDQTRQNRTVDINTHGYHKIFSGRSKTSKGRPEEPLFIYLSFKIEDMFEGEHVPTWAPRKVPNCLQLMQGKQKPSENEKEMT